MRSGTGGSDALDDGAVAAAFGPTIPDFRWVVGGCDFPLTELRREQFTQRLNSKGFWRVDQDHRPEHGLTVLAIIAFHDLQENIAACGGDVAAGVEAFCNQNGGEKWMLPETLRLADYGLGHDGRAKEHQAVRSCFGPRFYDWQLAQTPEES